MKTQAKPDYKNVRICYCVCHGYKPVMSGANRGCNHCNESGIPEVKSKHKHTDFYSQQFKAMKEATRDKNLPEFSMWVSIQGKTLQLIDACEL